MEEEDEGWREGGSGRREWRGRVEGEWREMRMEGVVRGRERMGREGVERWRVRERGRWTVEEKDGGWREYDGTHRADLHYINKHSHRPDVRCQGNRSSINNLRSCRRQKAVIVSTLQCTGQLAEIRKQLLQHMITEQCPLS